MKTKTAPESVSSPQDSPSAAKEDFIVRHVRQPNEPLTPEELRQLKALKEMPDSEIDFSDIPELTDKQLREFVHGPWTPREPHTVTLRLDSEVVEWLKVAATEDAHMINFILKREAQRWKERKAAQAATAQTEQTQRGGLVKAS